MATYSVAYVLLKDSLCYIVHDAGSLQIGLMWLQRVIRTELNHVLKLVLFEQRGPLQSQA